jgi:hypothetical protein
MDAPFHTVKVFMPKRYGSAFSDAYIKDKNTEKCHYISFAHEHVLKLNRTSWPLKRKIEFVLHVYTFNLIMNMVFSRD